MFRIALIAVALLGASPWLGPNPVAGSAQTKLDLVVDNYSLSEPDFARALITVASKFEIPVCIEWIQPKSPQSVILAWRHRTERQIFSSIVQAQPGYDFELEAGMVHVFYTGAKEDPSNFLNINISEFVLANTYTAVALQTLRQRVRARVVPPAPGSPISGGGETPLDPNDTRQTFEWQDASVRQILNGLTLVGAYRIWVVTFPEGPARTASGFRPTLSLWNPQAVPDALVDWDRFDWRHGPPPPNNRPR